MVEVSRLLSEVPIFGLVACLVAVFSRDPAREGVVPAPEPEPKPKPQPQPDGAAAEEPRPPEEGAAPSGPCPPGPGPRSLAAPDAAVQALFTLVPFVVGLVRRCGVPERDVPDVTQDVFTGLLRWCACRPAAELAAPEAHLRGYVRVVTVHRAIGYRRRAARRGEKLGWEPGRSEHGDQAPDTALGEAPCPEDLMLELEASWERTAETDLDRLSTATDAASWRAFYGHVVLGVPVKAIAEAEGVSPGAIYNRLRVARRDLRASILRYRSASRSR